MRLYDQSALHKSDSHPIEVQHIRTLQVARPVRRIGGIRHEEGRTQGGQHQVRLYEFAGRFRRVTDAIAGKHRVGDKGPHALTSRETCDFAVVRQQTAINRGVWRW